MKKLLLASACAITLTTFSSAAFADVRDDQIAEMQKQIEFLMQEVTTLRSERDSSKDLSAEFSALKQEQQRDRVENEVLQDKVSELEAQSVATIAPAAGPASGGSFSLSPGPTFTSADGRSEFAIGGKVHVEASLFNDDVADNPDGTNIRRAQIVAKGKFDEDWFFAFENEFAGNAVTVTDALLGYSGFENSEWKVGSFKEPFSSDFLTSDESNVFIEFASLNMFTPERSIGIGGSTHGDNWSFAAGAFGQGTGTASGVDEGWAGTGRLTYAPINEEGNVLHVGLSGTHRIQDDGEVVTLAANPGGANRATTAAVSTGAIANIGEATSLGLDASAILGPVMLQGRYVHSSLDSSTAGDLDFDGHYLQASWALTGESMTYNAGNGSLRRIKPANDFDLNGGGIGAWEIGARYDSVDLTDGTVSGGEMDNYVLGLNWYPNDRIRFMLNYTIVDTDSNAVTANDDPEILALRAQYDF
jgi:phosphate-selective porin OprO/OprP